MGFRDASFYTLGEDVGHPRLWTRPLRGGHSTAAIVAAAHAADGQLVRLRAGGFMAMMRRGTATAGVRGRNRGRQRQRNEGSGEREQQ